MKVFVYGQNVEGLKVHLLQSGHELVEDYELAAAAICYNWSPRFRRVLRGIKAQAIDNILIMSEPSVVTPEHANRSFLKSFDEIISVGRPGSQYLYPIKWDLQHFIGDQRRSRVVAMSANKFSWVAGEQYSLRRKIYALQAHLDVYGPGWDMSLDKIILMALKEALIAIWGRSRISLATLASLTAKPINSLGPAANKLNTLSRYKASLVVENSPEYMSEKLLEAMLAGTIPVYVGPSPGLFNIPTSLVIHAGNTLEEVDRACQLALDMDYASWAKEAQTWLLDPKTQEAWMSGNFFEKVISAVCRSR